MCQKPRSIMQFFETVMGHRFFETTAPRIAGALEKRNTLLSERNDLLKERNVLLQKQIDVSKEQTEAILNLSETIKWSRK